MQKAIISYINNVLIYTCKITFGEHSLYSTQYVNYFSDIVTLAFSILTYSLFSSYIVILIVIKNRIVARDNFKIDCLK